MSAKKRPGSFLREAAFGFVVSLGAAVLAITLTAVLPAGTVARFVIAGIGLALVLRVLVQSREKTGRIVTICTWLAATAAAWLSGVGLAAYFAIHLAIVWLVRSLFACSRALEAGFELALMLLAASFASYAAARTGSVFLASWSFLLVIALGAAIPAVAARLIHTPNETMPADDPNRGFALALKAADEALQRLASRQRV